MQTQKCSPAEWESEAKSPDISPETHVVPEEALESQRKKVGRWESGWGPGDLPLVGW